MLNKETVFLGKKSRKKKKKKLDSVAKIKQPLQQSQV